MIFRNTDLPMVQKSGIVVRLHKRSMQIPVTSYIITVYIPIPTVCVKKLICNLKTKFQEYCPAAAQNETQNKRNKNEDVKTNSSSREKFAADSRRCFR